MLTVGGVLAGADGRAGKWGGLAGADGRAGK